MLAEGRTAEVYAWGSDRVLKLYRTGWTYEVAEREARKTKAAHDSGAPAPGVHGVLEDRGRPGILMDRVDGHPMSAAVDLARPEPSARALAELHARLHVHRAPLLGPQHDELARRIGRAHGLSGAQKRTALARLDAMPRGEVLCHGDFHLDSIILTRDGPVVIDWMDATRGDPMADVARSLILIRHAHHHITDTPRRRAVLHAAARFGQAYLDHYTAHTETDGERALGWMATNAAARLSEGIIVEQRALTTLADLPP
ncbi:phosphotransferase [Candidatus Poribacteria bacterium]|nr:phosphotransferase [Candidatus Poribacteria bacterium]MBT5536528.1 phosphotransferase [Candidatus Poribacteria bacterium]MBT5713824.1 phosphotransferase [Candidatus Poribacteria bacterium]MBT7097859.1 phosphotransferase [Candidatus Poribacteria bacterium]MBT7809670.1 phosphotransferase [Candidatus Poribacteria bacterium]